jgi:SAM-dependent methyltransferase
VITDLRYDEAAISAETLKARPHARIPALADVIDLLAAPETGKGVGLTPDALALTDGTHVYALRDGLPVLLPARLQPFFDGHLQVPVEAASDALLKYFALASFRHGGDINAPSADVHFQRHLHRIKAFVAGCHGVILDVGCDDAEIGASLFSEGSRYLGLDPFCVRSSPFRLVGVGEYLPIRSASMDVVVFNTTLDHIFDWHRALEEAHRALKAGGQLIIATLVWTARADLLGDSIHFHHFRDYEIFGALSEFTVEDVARYDYKGDSHRHGLYVRARKL